MPILQKSLDRNIRKNSDFGTGNGVKEPDNGVKVPDSAGKLPDAVIKSEHSYAEIMADDILAIELCDTAENIFSRLVFSDENDVIYTDDLYKNEHKDHYLKEIQDYYRIWFERQKRRKLRIMGHSDIGITMNVYNHVADTLKVESEMTKADNSNKSYSVG